MLAEAERKSTEILCASVCYLPITLANLPVKPGDPSIPPTAVCDPLDVRNLQAKGSGKADHRMQLRMCCTATHRGVSSGSPHLGEVNMPTPCFSPQSESAPTRNDYIFECHMRQWPLSHAEKKPLLWNFCWQAKEDHKHIWAQCIRNMHAEILLQVESTEWGDIYVQANPSIDDIWEWSKHHNAHQTLSLGNKSAPFVAFGHRDSAGSDDSWFARDNQSCLLVTPSQLG